MSGTSTAQRVGTEPSSRLWNSYVGKFGVGLLAIVLPVSIAGVNAYMSLADGMTPTQRAGLVSGLLTIGLSFVVVSAFVAVAVGRESIDSLRLLTERAREMERGDLDVEVETNRSDELGELYQSFAAMRDSLRARIRRTERQNRQLRRSAEAHSDVMRAIADGDLSRRMNEDVDEEVMGDLAVEFNRMMDQLQRRTEEYTGVMRGIADGDLSRRMNEDVDEPMMADLGAEFNDMMDDLEATVVQVRRFTEAVSMASGDLASQTEQAMEASKRVGDAAAAVTDGPDDAVPAYFVTGDDGDAAADLDVEPDADTRLVAGGDEPLPADIDTGETVDAIGELSDRMDRIDEVTEFIARVATETNMLALNAGIEASKVDEGAEGFEVVAREVKSLAEETRESAGEIEGIAAEMRSGTSEAITSILRQQAALLLVMNRQAEDLSGAASELQDLTERLHVSSSLDGSVDGNSGSSGVLAGTDLDGTRSSER